MDEDAQAAYPLATVGERTKRMKHNVYPCKHCGDLSCANPDQACIECVGELVDELEEPQEGILTVGDGTVVMSSPETDQMVAMMYVKQLRNVGLDPERRAAMKKVVKLIFPDGPPMTMQDKAEELLAFLIEHKMHICGGHSDEPLFLVDGEPGDHGEEMRLQNMTGYGCE